MFRAGVAPAMSRVAIEAIMHTLIKSVACPDCRASLKEHVENICTGWLLLEVRLPLAYFLQRPGTSTDQEILSGAYHLT